MNRTTGLSACWARRRWKRTLYDWRADGRFDVSGAGGEDMATSFAHGVAVPIVDDGRGCAARSRHAGGSWASALKNPRVSGGAGDCDVNRVWHHAGAVGQEHVTQAVDQPLTGCWLHRRGAGPDQEIQYRLPAPERIGDSLSDV